METPEPIRANLGGEMAAAVRAEAILGELDVHDVVTRALGLYLQVMPEIRAGGELLIQVNTSDNFSQNKSGLRGFASRIGDMAAGVFFGEEASTKKTTLRVIKLDEWQDE